MAGRTIKQLKIKENLELKHVAVKESVFPFNKFTGADTVLGPEMKSTGEVMGIDEDFGRAYYKAQIAAGQKLPMRGNVFISVKNKDKRDIVFVVKKLEDMGFGIVATEGTANALGRYGIKVQKVNKVGEKYPTILDIIKTGNVNLIINTPVKKGPGSDDYQIRTLAIAAGVPYTTTMSGAQAVVCAIEAVKKKGVGVKPLQEYYKSKG
jgi:carbamoyl-phosphate synthase large subunit